MLGVVRANAVLLNVMAAQQHRGFEEICYKATEAASQF